MLVKLIKRLLLFLPILLFMAGFNYCVDPGNIFKTPEYYDKIADILLKGENVANLINLDERLLKKSYINGVTSTKDILVLGSSRVMMISYDMFPGQTFFNDSVSSASIEDDMVLYWLFRKKGLIPRVVILGLDPWILNKFNGNRILSIKKDYDEISNYLLNSISYRSNGIFSSKYFELIKPEYTQLSFRLWFKSLLENKKSYGGYYSTMENVANDMIRRADGSISYDAKYRNISTADARLLAIAFSTDKNNAAMLDNFYRFDPALIDKFDKFVNLMVKDNVKVIFYLPPYHPVAYDYFINSEKFGIILETQKYFEDYAKSKNIYLIGSYNPADSHLDESDFYDGMHLNIESVRRIMEEKAYIFDVSTTPAQF